MQEFIKLRQILTLKEVYDKTWHIGQALFKLFMIKLKLLLKEFQALFYFHHNF